MTWKGKTEEISGGEQDTTNLRMEVTAACVALEMINERHKVTVYSDSSYLVNCMKRGWYEKWRENGWLNYVKEPVAKEICGKSSWKRHSATGKCDGGKSKDTPRPEARIRPGTIRPTSSPWPLKRRQRDRYHHIVAKPQTQESSGFVPCSRKTGPSG